MYTFRTLSIPRRHAKKREGIHNHIPDPTSRISYHQCAACGLRIRLPAGADVSFIDAAHLLPWDRFHNDHPAFHPDEKGLEWRVRNLVA